jgi:pyruvate dehydrogenase phosphatase
VTWRRTASKEGKQLRWIVMATDGLWDMLPTQEVGNLVSAHLDGTRGTYSATALQARLEGAATAAQSTAAADGDEAAAQQQLLAKRRTGHHPLNAGRENQYTFEDANLATHLIRNALGGADTDRLTSLLAIPAPESRRYRDDVTVS